MFINGVDCHVSEYIFVIKYQKVSLMNLFVEDANLIYASSGPPGNIFVLRLHTKFHYLLINLGFPRHI